VSEETKVVLLSRGVEIECTSPVYRPAIESAPGGRENPEVVAGSIVVELPRRWKKPRGCKVRTGAGDFSVKAVPLPDTTVRLEGKNIAAVAAALHLKR
jgi:hypothetical protein